MAEKIVMFKSKSGQTFENENDADFFDIKMDVIDITENLSICISGLEEHELDTDTMEKLVMVGKLCENALLLKNSSYSQK